MTFSLLSTWMISGGLVRRRSTMVRLLVISSGLFLSSFVISGSASYLSNRRTLSLNRNIELNYFPLVLSFSSFVLYFFFSFLCFLPCSWSFFSIFLSLSCPFSFLFLSFLLVLFSDKLTCVRSLQHSVMGSSLVGPSR